MFQINQCVHVPLGASGSSTINTNECAAGETPFQLSAGDKSAPVHVYFLGISLPFANAVAFSTGDIAVPFFGSQEPDYEALRNSLENS
jgi:hypothetical protein